MALLPINDHLTLDDKLGRIGLLHEVYHRIRRASPPCVIGIHGDWGSGKSSFLIQLEALLTNFTQKEGAEVEPPKDERAKAEAESLRGRLTVGINSPPTFPVVWFEAWRYQNDPQPVLTLLREIRKQLSPGRKALSWLTKEMTVAIETALAGIDGISKFIGVKLNPKEIRAAGERYEAANFEVPSFTVSVTEVLDRAIGQIVGVYRRQNKCDRVVVMIDDLDRCSPETAQAILEGLRVFLNLKQVVFVIAMDETVVRELIAAKFKDDKDPELPNRRARQYLEKLCQAFYHLPFAQCPESRMLELLSDHGIDSARDALASAWGMAPRPGVTAEGPEPRWSDPSPVRRHVPPNARKLKLLADACRRFLLKIPKGAVTTRTVSLAYTLAYCFQFESDVYRLIETHRAEVINSWLFPLVTSGADLDPAPVALTLPRGLKPDSSSFPDPIRANVFYPAWVLANCAGVTNEQLEVFFR